MGKGLKFVVVENPHRNIFFHTETACDVSLVCVCRRSVTSVCVCRLYLAKITLL